MFQKICSSYLYPLHSFSQYFSCYWYFCFQKLGYFGCSYNYHGPCCWPYYICLYSFSNLGCTKTDFTGAGPYLFMFSLVLVCFGIGLIFWKNSVAQLVYSCLGALLFCIYIIYDTQLIAGSGKFKYTLDEAYLAAIMLYMDIVNLFLYILRIIGR